MSTLAQTRDIALLRQFARSIPDTISPDRLRQLERRYTTLDDPVVAVLPAAYRGTILARIRALIAATPAIEQTHRHAVQVVS